MKLTSLHWVKIRNSKPRDFTPAMLHLCTSDELVALCHLLGIPYSGTKPFKISRILDICDLRQELSTWGEYQDTDFLRAHEKAHSIATLICARYKRSDLILLAKRAKTFYSLPKLGIVTALLSWRDRSRYKGKQFNSQLHELAKVQYVFPFIRTP